jgi:hypothetical protein
MSDFKRFKRAVKSMLPRIGKKRDRYYDYGDARLMINDLGLQMSADVLAYLVSRTDVLEDFIQGVYFFEDDIRKKDVVIDPTVINSKYEPKVYVEDGKVEFTASYGGDEIIFAEYQLPEGMK